MTNSGAQIPPIGIEGVKLLNERPAPEDVASESEAAEVFPPTPGDGYYIGVPNVLARFFCKGRLEGLTVHVLRYSFAR